jgi:glyoxylase-like metal-dependent hydrolase (beta-lactamase superfamily II)
MAMDFHVDNLTIKKIPELESAALPMNIAFPDVTRDDLKRVREWYWDGQMNEDPALGKFEMAFHSYVLQADGKNILIDTCNGNHKNRELAFCNELDTPYLDNLKAAGLTPNDIDMVLCTHLHFDHVGWNTRLENGQWIPTFPNARYLFTKADYEHFSKNRLDPIHGAAFIDSVVPIVEHGLAELVDADHIVEREIGDGVWLEGSPGHSPGSCRVHAKRGNNLVIFSGDTFHHPLELHRPEMPFFGDDDQDLAGKTRRHLFDQHAGTSALFFPAHFGGYSGGRIHRHNASFRFEFVDPAALDLRAGKERI